MTPAHPGRWLAATARAVFGLVVEDGLLAAAALATVAGALALSRVGMVGATPWLAWCMFAALAASLLVSVRSEVGRARTKARRDRSSGADLP